MAPRPYFNENGEVLPLVELMKLERLDDWTFRSCSQAYAPTGGANGAYGGFVYSIAAWAAAHTVEEGLILHVGSVISLCSILVCETNVNNVLKSGVLFGVSAI